MGDDRSWEESLADHGFRFTCFCREQFSIAPLPFHRFYWSVGEIVRWRHRDSMEERASVCRGIFCDSDRGGIGAELAG